MSFFMVIAFYQNFIGFFIFWARIIGDIFSQPRRQKFEPRFGILRHNAITNCMKPTSLIRIKLIAIDLNICSKMTKYLLCNKSGYFT